MLIWEDTTGRVLGITTGMYLGWQWLVSGGDTLSAVYLVTGSDGLNKQS